MSDPLPLEGPLSRDAFFSSVAPAAHLPPCKRLAIGTAGLGGAWGSVNVDDSVRALHAAWDAGFLLTDTAPSYADAERLVGRALREWSAAGGRPVLCTKIGGWFEEPLRRIHTRQRLAAQLDHSQELFGRPPDAVAIHDAADWHGGSPEEALELLVARRQQGCIRAIGMGGGGPGLQCAFLASGQLNYLITFKRLAAVTLQAMRDVVPAACEHRVSIFAGSPVFMGLLTDRLPQIEKNLPAHIAPVFARRARRVDQIARDAGIPLAQLATRFLLSLPMVNVVIAGASNPQEWKDCLAAYEAGPLSADVYARIWPIAQDGNEPCAGG